MFFFLFCFFVVVVFVCVIKKKKKKKKRIKNALWSLSCAALIFVAFQLHLYIYDEEYWLLTSAYSPPLDQCNFIYVILGVGASHRRSTVAKLEWK